MKKVNRKDFMTTAFAGTLGISLSTTSFAKATGLTHVDPLEPTLVKEFVGAGHGRFPKVKELLEEYPNLIYSSWDWGHGDFESGIEAAGHVGNKEIANYLLENGARPNLFVLTMLGKSDLVIPILDAYPALIQAKGAHGFTLLHHAKVGGEDAAEMMDFLKDKGLKDFQFKLK